MTEREVMADLVKFVGVLTYGKERWFKQNGCWYDRMFGDYIQNEVLLERITKAINDEIEDRPTGEVNAVKLYEGAVNDLENNKITLGEFEKRIEPLKHLYYDRPTGEMSDRLLKESDVLKIAFQLPFVVNSAFFDAVKALPSAKPKTEWIPVSEKPKEEERTYLVQLDGGGMRSCRWTNSNPIWTELTTDWHWNIFDIPQYCKVVAWMDLEPYKGGDSDG